MTELYPNYDEVSLVKNTVRIWEELQEICIEGYQGDKDIELVTKDEFNLLKDKYFIYPQQLNSWSKK